MGHSVIYRYLVLYLLVLAFLLPEHAASQRTMDAIEASENVAIKQQYPFCLPPSAGMVHNLASLSSPVNRVVRTKTDDEVGPLLFEMTNKERQRNGLNPLRLSSKLCDLAALHSSDMCAARKLAHESDAFPKGRRKFKERMTGIGLTAGAENIAFFSLLNDNKKLATEVVKGWMESPQHRENILNNSFSHVGFGTFVCANGLVYITQLFSDKP